MKRKIFIKTVEELKDFLKDIPNDATIVIDGDFCMCDYVDLIYNEEYNEVEIS